ncbi:hypothetical protein, partial [Barnesiella intestinihominis]|uniref:hypothetical protein n=1 Tax=Barnesiella intestinihominis TaxID=487174 RepID=UPI00241E27FA
RAIDKNQGILDARQGLNRAGTYLLAMIILFLYKFKTVSKYFHIFHLPFDRLSAIFLTFVF